MKIKSLEHFKQLAEKYQNSFGSAMFDLDGTLYGSFDLYRILRNYMKENNITTVTLPKGDNWDDDFSPKHVYVMEFSAFKVSGKYYSGLSHKVLETNSDSFTDDFPKLVEIKEELSKDLDAACGLRPGSIKENNFIVLIDLLDIKDTNSQSCFKSLIK